MKKKILLLAVALAFGCSKEKCYLCTETYQDTDTYRYDSLPDKVVHSTSDYTPSKLCANHHPDYEYDTIDSSEWINTQNPDHPDERLKTITRHTFKCVEE